MRKMIVGMIVLMLVVSGCGKPDKESNAAASSTPNSSSSPVVTPAAADASPTAAPSATPAPKQTEGKTKLSAEEQLAVEYLDVYQNGTDTEAKKKFVSDKVDPEVKSLFELGAASTTQDKVSNPRVMETVEYNDTGKKGTLTLIKVTTSQGTDEDWMFLTREGKIGFLFAPIKSTDSRDATYKKSYEDMRARFKTK